MIDSVRLDAVDGDLARRSNEVVRDLVLYRILGNDLPPRHGKEQTIRNVQFILQHEEDFVRLQKKWILNRIVDKCIESRLHVMLREAGHDVVLLPFEREQFAQLQPDFSHFEEQDFLSILTGKISTDWLHTLRLDHAFHEQNKYLMNVNAARNVALTAPHPGVKWIMPWDGNCFLHRRAFGQIIACVHQAQTEKYLVVPMERVIDNEMLLVEDPSYEALEEPQLIFRWDALERFDEDLRYGRYSKVEFLKRIGFPGAWDKWEFLPWENRKWTESTDDGRWMRAGWVARLNSGHDATGEDPSLHGMRRRGQARRTAVRNFITHRVSLVAEEAASKRQGLVYDFSLLTRCNSSRVLCRIRAEVLQAASLAVEAPLLGVVDKTQTPHDRDESGYRNMGSSPNTQSELYLQRNGLFDRETSLAQAIRPRFRNDHLQIVFDRVTTLALATRLTGQPDYAARADSEIEKLVGESAMHSRMTHGQLKRDDASAGIFSNGMIEAKGIHYFLDGVEMLRDVSALRPRTYQELKSWCASYLCWLQNSAQGCEESTATDGHGTYWELQVSALAKFLGQFDEVANSWTRCRARLFQQFASDGNRPVAASHESNLDYRLFNLQCWLTLAHMFRRLDLNLMAHFDPPKLAVDTLIKDYRSPDCLSFERGVPVAEPECVSARLSSMKALAHQFWPEHFRRIENIAADEVTNFHSHLGVVPFWPLMLWKLEQA